MKTEREIKEENSQMNKEEKIKVAANKHIRQLQELIAATLIKK